MKFPAFYGTRMFITAFTIFHQLSLSSIRPIQSIPSSQSLKIHSNITLPSTAGSSKWTLPLRCFQPKPYMHLSLPLRATCPAHLILLHFITRMVRIVIKYKISSNYDSKFARPTICQRNQVDKRTMFEIKLNTTFKKIRQSA